MLSTNAVEAQVGDITPSDGIAKPEKQKLEAEYEDGVSAEARFVKDLDRFEMASQALEYERNHNAQTLQPFFDSSLPLLRHPEVKQWGEDLATERANFKQSQPN
ncbi:hypothetical protein EUX98_g4672 [Antrodiella citrinella]|uniref:HD domain-containing protein n=1 Tax=Antrodiella citrinella TaxID=2447956 RepID=A0A4S4MVW3_9APHY|nr:hypothetical protein EUX98_g4672 [Antrodiella citrinella]